MGTKIMVDFPAFITRDSETKHILVGDESFALVPNGIIAETYPRLLQSAGYDKSEKIMVETIGDPYCEFHLAASKDDGTKTGAKTGAGQVLRK